MTKKELSQVYYLNLEIKRYQRKLAELESRCGISAINMDGMPHAQGNTGSQVEQAAAEIVDLQAIIHAKRIERIHERSRLERYISEIPDSVTRLIFMYRFVDCLKWDQVADQMGGRHTGDSVRMRCNRYLNIQKEFENVTECSV